MRQEKSSSIISAFIIIITVTIIIGALYKKEGIRAAPPSYIEKSDIDNKPSFLALNPKEGLWDALKYYEVQHPEIVYAQAILESGLGKSKVYLRTNNLFGLYNSRTKNYYKFNHWSESVIAYKNYIQKRYESPKDYYQFLNEIGYASDPEYIQKLKSIVRNEQRKGLGRDTSSP